MRISDWSSDVCSSDLCWRGLVGGVLVVAYVGWLERLKPLRRRFHLDRQGWLLAGVGSLASLAFIFSFKLTYVANVAVIYATAPFIAAALGWLLMRERLRVQTAIAATVSIFGIVVVFAGSLGTELGREHVWTPVTNA